MTKNNAHSYLAKNVVRPLLGVPEMLDKQILVSSPKSSFYPCFRLLYAKLAEAM